MLTVSIERLLAEDAREKRQARGGQFCGKKSPRVLVMPGDLRGKSREPPYTWLTAEPIVHVNIVTGEVLTFRWPLENLKGMSDDANSARARGKD